VRLVDRFVDGIIVAVRSVTDWSHRPLDEIYAAVFIDAIVVKVRDGQVANRPFYAAIGVTLDGEKDILGLAAGRSSWRQGVILSGALVAGRNPVGVPP
jgi:transposase-like protein